ncbi:MAG: hypothetical protein OQL11_04510 [Gammaproteobacteria bacterium]|nr:hypothetical protein [Gammaproteobacteria bacterium]
MAEQDPEQNTDLPIKGVDAAETRAAIEQQLAEYEAHLAAMPANAPVVERARVVLDKAEALLGLDRKAEAWQAVLPLIDPLVAADAWQEAVEACDILYQTEQEDSIVALGHGVWLGVTYPIKAQTTVTMLSHVIDETPPDSDGAAVAAMVAHYLAGLRTEGKERESLTFLTTQLIAKVAKRHRNIEDQATLNTWIEMYELNNIEKLFPRLALIVDAIVGKQWWFDRDELRTRLPVN